MYIDEKILKNIGLSEAESVIYINLLKLGSSNVKDISERCKYHRSNLYDILDQLLNKGLVNTHNEKNIRYYKAVNPDHLNFYLKEKEDFLSSIMKKLKEVQNNLSDEAEVEVYKGEEGMKFLFRDIIRCKKSLYAIGVRGQLREQISEGFVGYFARELEKNKIKYYPIYTTRKFDPPYYTEIRYLPEEHTTPVVTFIYGDKVCINIWKPTLIAIIIKSKDIAKTYKKYFDMLWGIAEK